MAILSRHKIRCFLVRGKNKFEVIIIKKNTHRHELSYQSKRLKADHIIFVLQVALRFDQFSAMFNKDSSKYVIRTIHCHLNSP